MKRYQIGILIFLLMIPAILGFSGYIYKIGDKISIGRYSDDFDGAITAIGSDEYTLVIDTNIVVTQDVTVPATCGLEVGVGGSLTYADANVDLTINGPVQAGPYQWIDPNRDWVTFGAGSVDYGYAEWYGIDGTADEDEINAILTALGTGGHLKLLDRTYTISANITPLSYQLIEGTAGTTIYLDTNAALSGGMISISGKTGVKIKNLTIDGNYDNQNSGAWYGINIASSSSECEITGCKVFDCRYDSTNDCACIRIISSDNNMISNCIINGSNNNYIVYGGNYNTITNCQFEGNYLSEAVSFFAPTSYETRHNVISNCTFKDVRQGIYQYGGIYTEVSNCTIINASDVALGISDGGISVSNVNIVGGASTAQYFVSVGQAQYGDITYDYPINLTNVFVDCNGANYRGFHVSYSGPNRVTLTGCRVYNSGTSLDPNTVSDGFGVQAGSHIDFIGCVVEDITGNGFEVETSSTDVNFFGCRASNCGQYGLRVNSTGLIGGSIAGGTYINNGQNTADTYYGISISSTANHSIFLDDSIQVYDDQNSTTQHIAGIDVGTYSGNLITGSSPPTRGYFFQGQKVWKKAAAAGAAPGWVCVSRIDTEVKVAIDPNDTSIDVDSTTNMAGSDIIGIKLNSGSWHWTTISSVDDGDTLTIADQMPSAAAVDRRVITFRFKEMGDLDA